MDYAIELRTLERTDTAAVRLTTTMPRIGADIGQAFGEVMQYLQANGIQPTGLAFARFHSMGEEIDMEAGFSVPGAITGAGRVRPGELPAGEAAVTLHAGPYDAIGPAYEAIEAWLAAHNRKAAGAPWEVYLTPPDVQPPRTEVVFPLLPA